jgi:hypothetical protein
MQKAGGLKPRPYKDEQKKVKTRTLEKRKDAAPKGRGRVFDSGRGGGYGGRDGGVYFLSGERENQ